MPAHKSAVTDPEVPVWTDAPKALIKADPLLEPIIRKVGSPRIIVVNDQFQAITLSILRQQVHSALADSIVDAVAAPYGGVLPAAEQIVAGGRDALRVKGLTPQRVDYVWDFARQVVDKTDIAVAALNANKVMGDDAAMKAVRAVRGVGPWSASMVLIFGHARGDVLVPKDANLRGALHRLLGMKEKATDEDVSRRAPRWAPHRSAALWYMWHSRENIHPGLA